MALIQCPECQLQVSSRAPTCPHCGAPVAREGEARVVGAPLATIQERSKSLKGQAAAAVLVVLVGCSAAVIHGLALAPGEVYDGALWVWMAALGALWYLATRVRIWWHHE